MGGVTFFKKYLGVSLISPKKSLFFQHTNVQNLVPTQNLDFSEEKKKVIHVVCDFKTYFKRFLLRLIQVK